VIGSQAKKEDKIVTAKQLLGFLEKKSVSITFYGMRFIEFIFFFIFFFESSLQLNKKSLN
jgi:hypothetical protein